MALKDLLPEGIRIVKRRIEGKLKRFYRLPPLDSCKEYVAETLIKVPDLFEHDLGL
jgi:hypothetical protein